MKHTPTPPDPGEKYKHFADAELETARLRLRRFVAGDAGELSLITGDREVMRFIGDGAPISPEETRRNLDTIIRGFDRRGFGRWAVTVKENNRLAGYCGLTLLDAEMGVELVCLLGRDYWGSGLAAEAAHASLRFAFEALELSRVVAMTKPDNARSRRVLERIGMKFQTRARYYGYACVRYELRREEFRPGRSPYRLLRRAGAATAPATP